MPTPIDFLKATVAAFKETLGQTPPTQKNDLVSIHSGKHFNDLLAKIKVEAPEAAGHLPPPITWTTDFALMGKSDIKFLELEMYVNQVVHVLNVLASDV